MNLRKLVFPLLFLLLSTEVAFAQDPQFSQFYAAPLYLNPAFAGSTGEARVGLNYRNQWPGLDANFTTVAAYGDYYADLYNSGFGFMVMEDREGLAGLTSTSVAAQYSYTLKLMDNLAFRAGLEGAFVSRDVNFDKLTFGDQFDQTGFLNIATAEVFNTGLKVNYVNFAAGGLLYTPNFFLGFSAHNLSTPNQSFLDGESLLPVKLSFHAGLKIPFGGATSSGRLGPPAGREKSVTPTIQYKTQGQFDQLDVGASLTLAPLVLGLYYRGLPVKSFESYTNNESAIFVVGLSKENLNLGYSYDHTLSELRGISGGAHEISISYVFSLRDPRRPSKDVMRIPCPKF